MYTSTLLFLNIGTPELMVIMFVVLLLFGGKKLPELARGLGKGIREFKDASDGVKREIHRNINAVNEEMDFERSTTTKSTSVPDYSQDYSSDPYDYQNDEYLGNDTPETPHSSEDLTETKKPAVKAETDSKKTPENN